MKSVRQIFLGAMLTAAVMAAALSARAQIQTTGEPGFAERRDYHVSEARSENGSPKKSTMCYLINSPMLPAMKASSILSAGEGTWKPPGTVKVD